MFFLIKRNRKIEIEKPIQHEQKNKKNKFSDEH